MDPQEGSLPPQTEQPATGSIPDILILLPPNYKETIVVFDNGGKERFHLRRQAKPLTAFLVTLLIIASYFLGVAVLSTCFILIAGMISYVIEATSLSDSPLMVPIGIIAAVAGIAAFITALSAPFYASFWLANRIHPHFKFSFFSADDSKLEIASVKSNDSSLLGKHCVERADSTTAVSFTIPKGWIDTPKKRSIFAEFDTPIRLGDNHYTCADEKSGQVDFHAFGTPYGEIYLVINPTASPEKRLEYLSIAAIVLLLRIHNKTFGRSLSAGPQGTPPSSPPKPSALFQADDESLRNLFS
ncbi:MAG: hypothetical protein ACO1RA_04425 [Planctomycetaceae bacterium]